MIPLPAESPASKVRMRATLCTCTAATTRFAAGHPALSHRGFQEA